MKKLMLNVLFVIAAIFQSVAQIDEKQLTLSDEQLNTATARMAQGNVDCKCEKNILKDGGFQALTNSTTPPLSNIGATSSPWQKGTLTPQWTNSAAACDNGFISMWGNQAVFESVKQTATIPATGCGYRIKFTARFTNGTSLINSVQLKFSVGAATVTSTPISSTAWATYTMTLPSAPTGTQTITLQPTNSHNVNNGAYVSWIQITNICFEALPECTPNFLVTLSELPTGNYQVSASPTSTAGFPHYWVLQEAASCPAGATTATSSNWNGFASATGAFSSTNPGITGGPTGYGYQYPGLGKGKCYRLIHYVYCCGKWKMQTKCFCLTSTARKQMSDSELNANVETKDVRYEELPAELRQRVPNQH
jgi:hypothetical protein